METGTDDMPKNFFPLFKITIIVGIMRIMVKNINDAIFFIRKYRFMRLIFYFSHCMRSLLKAFIDYYTGKNRWYLPIAAGMLSTATMPPFNGQLHPVLTLFPLLGFIAFVPLFACSLAGSWKRALLHTYCFGVGASVCQLYWIAFVVPEGLYHMIILGVLLLTMYEASFFAVNGLAFRFFFRRFPQLYVVAAAAWWVCIEYLKSVGEMSFPWNFVGYALTPLLPLAQVSSITGTYGLSFIVILGNCCAFEMARGWAAGQTPRKKIPLLGWFILSFAVISLWGVFRLNGKAKSDSTAQVSLIQPVIDQNHWGNNSLDASFSLIESLIKQASGTSGGSGGSASKPDAIIAPESALLCYLLRQPSLKKRVIEWSRSTKIPLVIGSLHWESSPASSKNDYLVYNTAYCLDSASGAFQPYYKMKLVPFSEILPFQGLFPILSRVNLGEADFTPGTKPVVFDIGPKIKGAPFICFDIIYPGFVRSRINSTTNLLVQITNDGWFGKSSGPYQHALYAQQRCIENGISLARSANTGISMIVDQYGRVLKKTRLGERIVLSGTVPLSRVPTLYTKLGDWPAGLSFALVAVLITVAILRKRLKKQ